MTLGAHNAPTSCVEPGRRPRIASPQQPVRLELESWRFPPEHLPMVHGRARVPPGGDEPLSFRIELGASPDEGLVIVTTACSANRRMGEA